MDYWEYRPVKFTGEFLNDYEFHIASRFHESKAGFHIVSPFKLQNTGYYDIINNLFFLKNL